MKKSFRQLLTMEGFVAPARGLDLMVAYVARLGAPAAGQKVFLRLRPVKNGFQGEPVQCVGLVAAARAA